jgi:hypothetical protein
MLFGFHTTAMIQPPQAPRRPERAARPFGRRAVHRHKREAVPRPGRHRGQAPRAPRRVRLRE